MLIDNQNYFPMEIISIAFREYVMDATGDVYSMASNKVVGVKGTMKKRGRYYVLNDVSYRKEVLVNMARRQKEWAEEMDCEF
jgi:hypothetical protein